MKTIGKIIWFISSGLAYFFYKNDATAYTDVMIGTSSIYVATYATDSTKCNGLTSNRCDYKTTNPNPFVDTGCGSVGSYFTSCEAGTANILCKSSAHCYNCPNGGETLNRPAMQYQAAYTTSTCCHHLPNGQLITNQATSYIVTYTIHGTNRLSSLRDCYLPADTQYTENGHTYKYKSNCYYK